MKFIKLFWTIVNVAGFINWNENANMLKCLVSLKCVISLYKGYVLVTAHYNIFISQ